MSYWDYTITTPNPTPADLQNPNKTITVPGRRLLGSGAGLRGKALDQAEDASGEKRTQLAIADMIRRMGGK